MNDQLVEQRRGELVLSTDRRRVDHATVYAMLAGAHWGGSVTPEKLARSIEHSVTVGVYDDATGAQLGFARVVTDLTTFAYLCDVIVAEHARGRGIGKWMVEAILSHPDLQGLRRFSLLTRDAQALYEKFGFTTDMPASRYMELRIEAR